MAIPSKLAEWIAVPPTHLSMEEAMTRAAALVRELVPEWDTQPINLRGEFLLMLMLYWNEHSRQGELPFLSRFYDWNKAT